MEALVIDVEAGEPVGKARRVGGHKGLVEDGRLDAIGPSIIVTP